MTFKILSFAREAVEVNGRLERRSFFLGVKAHVDVFEWAIVEDLRHRERIPHGLRRTIDDGLLCRGESKWVEVFVLEFFLVVIPIDFIRQFVALAFVRRKIGKIGFERNSANIRAILSRDARLDLFFPQVGFDCDDAMETLVMASVADDAELEEFFIRTAHRGHGPAETAPWIEESTSLAAI